MCVLSIKVPIRKKSGNFFNDPCKWVESSPMVRETWVQSQVESYQRLLKWYLIPPYLTLRNIRYVSRVNWSNPEKGVVPSPMPKVGEGVIEKGAFWSPSTTVAKFTTLLLLLYIDTNSIKYQLFVYTRLNDQTVLF